MPGQMLEIPQYAGGGGVPSVIPAPESLLRTQVAKGVTTQILGAPRQVIASALERQVMAKYGCCPCPGQQGHRTPYDQTPYSEPPGLGQPPRPQKPFQGQDRDPCEEALQRAGLDPDCLKRMLSSGRKAAAPRKRKTTTRRKTMRRGSSVSNRKRAETLMSRANAIAEAGGSLAEYNRLNKQADRLLGRMPTKRGKKKRVAARRSQAPRTTRGKYQLLQNGACYDPVARKFVKRSLCR